MSPPKHTPEPWEVHTTTDKGSIFAFVILGQPVGYEPYKPICMVLKDEHAEANSALAPPPGLLREDSPIVKKFEQVHEILAELEKAGAL